MSKLEKHWPQIMKLANRAFPKYAFATINADGSPHVTPMGSLILKDNCTGFYFEGFSEQMRENLNRDNRISVLISDFRLVSWIIPLLSGRFSNPNAVRLNGTVGKRREATQSEMDAFKKDKWAVNLARILRWRGYRILWEPLSYVRDIKFHAFESVNLGKMSHGHWE